VNGPTTAKGIGHPPSFVVLDGIETVKEGSALSVAEFQLIRFPPVSSLMIWLSTGLLLVAIARSQQ
jgi:hypothetical protein